MPDGLYDTDLLAWSREQAERLRRVAAGERVNDVDWANVIEEIESVRRSDMRAVRSLFTNAIAHALRIVAWPDDWAVRHWQIEAGDFLFQGRERFEPSMRQLFVLDRMYEGALNDVGKASLKHRVSPLPVPGTVPFALDDLLRDDVRIEDMIVRIGDAAPPA